MIYFISDYSQGAHPEVLRALNETNFEHTDGYGMDAHCENAGKIIKELIGRDDCEVHMMVGGTPCNVTVIAATLRPFETVIAARSGHAYVHETGAVEATGHRVTTVPGTNGKLTPALIEEACLEYQDEHTPRPALVYISQPTETGTIYKKEELEEIYKKCREKSLRLYIDGARLGSALTCGENDMSIKDIARLCDAFYIGGTKNGALFGEALVIFDKEMNRDFRFMIKRQCSMLAKGRLIGVQFEALLRGGEQSVYFEAARHANALAEKLRRGLISLGIRFYADSPTNQLFPMLPADVVTGLEEDFLFIRWAPEEDGLVPVRLVCGFGTKEEEVDALLSRIEELTR